MRSLTNLFAFRLILLISAIALFSAPAICGPPAVEGMHEAVMSVLAAAPAPAFIDASIAIDQIGASGVYVCAVKWVTSPGASTIVDIQIETLPVLRGLWIYQVETVPGATAPTASYDITISDARGLDLMGAALNNRSASAAEMAFPATAARPVDSDLTIAISGNSVSDARGEIRIYFVRASAPPR